PAVGWPIFVTTCLAVAVQWGPDDVAKAASFGWAAFAISAGAFSVTVAKAEGEWFVLPDHSGIRYLVSGIERTGRLALPLSAVLLALTSLVSQSVSKRSSTPAVTLSDKVDKMRLNVTPDTLVRVSAPLDAALKIGLLEQKRTARSSLVMVVKNGAQTMIAADSSDDPYLMFRLRDEFSRNSGLQPSNVIGLTVGES